MAELLGFTLKLLNDTILNILNYQITIKEINRTQVYDKSH